MKLLTRSLVAALALTFGYGSGLLAGDCGCAAPACNSCDLGCNDCGCFDDCCTDCCDPGVGWGLFGEAELLFLRYHRADGVRIGGGGPGAGVENGEFDFEPSMRYTLGLIAPNGIGARVRYFEYDHFEQIEDAGDGLGVDTYTIDGELFETFELNRNWAMEISGGVRYTGFLENMVDVGAGDSREISFYGAGLVTGLEVRRSVGFGLLYARTRMAVVQDDKHITNVDGGAAGEGASNAGAIASIQDVELVDTTNGMLELAIGGEVNYELSNGSVLFARSGLEWQNWWNFSNSFEANGVGVVDTVLPGGGVAAEGIFDGPSDVGFGGFTFSAGISY